MTKFEIVNSENEDLFYVKCSRKDLMRSRLHRFNPVRTEHGWRFNKDDHIPVTTKIVKATMVPSKKIIYIESSHKLVYFLSVLNIFLMIFFRFEKELAFKNLRIGM